MCGYCVGADPKEDYGNDLVFKEESIGKNEGAIFIQVGITSGYNSKDERIEHPGIYSVVELFDNEVCDGFIKINYCPICGRKLTINVDFS